jgi:hypothetical protein
MSLFGLALLSFSKAQFSLDESDYGKKMLSKIVKLSNSVRIKMVTLSGQLQAGWSEQAAKEKKSKYLSTVLSLKLCK